MVETKEVEENEELQWELRMTERLHGVYGVGYDNRKLTRDDGDVEVVKKWV